MEGEIVASNKLRFIESKRRLKIHANNAIAVKLITAANNHGLIIIAFENIIKGLSTDQLFEFDRSKKTELITSVQFSLTLQVTFKPTLLTVARYGYSSTLLVTGINPTTIEAFDLDTQSSICKLNINELDQHEVIDYSWHPNYYESIVALCTSRGNLLVIAIDKKNKAMSMALNLSIGSLSCAWSPKGKNLAVGKIDGTVMRLEPVIESNKFIFKEVDKSTINFLPHLRITPEHRVIKLRWLNKTYLLSVHAKPGNAPDTVYSIFTLKPSKPNLFWSNICIEDQNTSNYNVHVVNLSNLAVCISSVSGEAATIGVDSAEAAKNGELKDYKNLIIEEEGARIELPLDLNNRETYSNGVAATFSGVGKPILVFYTTDGVICAYLMEHAENIMRLPEFQKPQEVPITVPLQGPPLGIKARENQSKKVEFNTSVHYLSSFPKELNSLKKGTEYNEMFLTLLEEINYLRKKFKDIQEDHVLHKELFDAVKEDINALDIGMLENLYLIEYIKSRSSGISKKKSLDPITSKKVEQMKQKLKLVAEKLKDLNVHVDVSWEVFSRRRTAHKQINSLDIIYQTLATNQKIITALQRKLITEITSQPPKSVEFSCDIASSIRELKPAKMMAFREFLSSRSIVPFRRPLINY